MHDLPDISVIIPTRNRPELLRRALHSVLSQSLQSFEIVVVLDGEDTKTAEAVATFADARIRLLTLRASVGGSEARNIGARSATGRYIALLDDDDEWLPNRLALQLKMAETHTGANYVVVSQYLYRVEGHPDEVWPGHLPRSKEPLSEFLFSSRGGFQTSTYLCPRELLLRIPFSRGLPKHQDWDWFLQLAALPGFAVLVVPQPLSIYWVPAHHRASISGTPDWKFSRDWATSRLPLMTRKAYARFLIKICVRSAKAQGCGPLAFLTILGDLIFISRPTPFLLAEFFVSSVLPLGLRAHLRTAMQTWRCARTVPRDRRTFAASQVEPRRDARAKR